MIQEYSFESVFASVPSGSWLTCDSIPSSRGAGASSLSRAQPAISRKISSDSSILSSLYNTNPCRGEVR